MKATESRATARVKADEPEVREEPEETPAEPQTRIAGQCVVKSDFHVGRAVNGEVCSYHAMHYDPQGNPR